MLLAIDIGNTGITLGVFDGEELKATWQISTGIHRAADEYAALLLNLISRGSTSSEISGVAICSVVPPLIAVFEEVCQRYFQLSPLVVGAGVKTRVRIRMDNPREVGADRIANAVAAHHLYSGPLIIVDLGTATTFDVLSKEGDYIGGAIAPGISTAAEALFMRAAKLPRVEMLCPPRAIGSNTVAAMQSGIIFGYISLIEGMVARIQKELDQPAKVIATGGYAELIARETEVINMVNPNLTLVGLRLIYQMNMG